MPYNSRRSAREGDRDKLDSPSRGAAFRDRAVKILVILPPSFISRVLSVYGGTYYSTAAVSDIDPPSPREMALFVSAVSQRDARIVLANIPTRAISTSANVVIKHPRLNGKSNRFLSLFRPIVPRCGITFCYLVEFPTRYTRRILANAERISINTGDILRGVQMRSRGTVTCDGDFNS